jgi:hypothetical protein
MDRNTRYYRIEFSTKKGFNEEMYIQVKEDKTITGVKEAKKDSEITLLALCTELTAREYVEITNGFEHKNSAIPEGLELRIERMKE